MVNSRFRIFFFFFSEGFLDHNAKKRGGKIDSSIDAHLEKKKKIFNYKIIAFSSPSLEKILHPTRYSSYD